jgi:hypothetical protein
MLYRVKKVEYLDGYRLKLKFTNGSIRIVDLSNRLKSAKNLFLDLTDLDYFKQVKCDGYSIIWPNGIDFCPNVLYEMGKPVTETKKKQRKTASVSARRKRSKLKA